MVQLVGIIVGAYSSIFFATPLLVSIKERWGPVAAHTKKVLARRETRSETAAAPAAAAEASAVASRVTAASPRPGARPTGKRDKKRR